MKFSLLLVMACLGLVTLTAHAADESPSLKTGSPAPDFTAYAANGHATKLSDFHGKVVLVDFWATWCGPCREAMPRVEALHQKLKDLVVLGVCVSDEKKNFADWQAHPKVPTTYTLLFDQAGRSDDSAIMNDYRLSEIPTFYLIGKDGKVLYAGVGSGEDNETGLKAALKAAGFTL